MCRGFESHPAHHMCGFMYRYILVRILLIPVTVISAGSIAFFLLQLVPGDYVNTLNSEGGASFKSMKVLREDLGLTEPTIVQYVKWLKEILSGSLGYSVLEDKYVLPLLSDKLETTLTLSILSLIFSLLVAIPLGTISAMKRGSKTDEIIRVLTAITIATPPFWIGLLIINLTSTQFNWVPPLFYRPLHIDPLTNLTFMVFPVLTIVLTTSSILIRLLRSMILEELSRDYVRTAYAKGLTSYSVILIHVIRNASIPIITMCGFFFSAVLGGAVVVEQVFNLPGLGSAIVVAILSRDTPMLLGIIIGLSVIMCIWILIIDLLYMLIDPRIKYS
ncbi:MAG: ABC transporter permease [SAR202 cluster bacterium]|nr:ABC transporter permease [SAR202 cluster bacterium]